MKLLTQSVQKSRFMVLQYYIVAMVVAVATDITEAVDVYCQYESKPYFARLWVSRCSSSSSSSDFSANAWLGRSILPATFLSSWPS